MSFIRVLLASLASAAAYPSALGMTDITTTNGKVSGILNNGVREWLGVPFAQPPIGPLRWEPPQPIKGNINIKAIKTPPACLQSVAQDNGVYGSLTDFQYIIQNQTSEDCLTLSIWAPEKEPKRKLPVLIFIHGGFFVSGGTSVPYQNPHNWVHRTQSHIVVTIQYRLGIFGFPNSAALVNAPTSQNLGFLDQRLAIEWVQQNIAKFGGDPDRVVIWGQSAGAISILQYAYSYSGDPLVSGFIVNSGATALTFGSLDVSNFEKTAISLGCVGNPEQQLQCLREKDAATIRNSASAAAAFFWPRPDNITSFQNFDASTVARRLSNLPAIIGSNTAEGFLCSQLPDISRRGDRLTFQYQYRGNFSNISPQPELGAYHSSELPLIFGTHANANGPSTQLEIMTSEVFQDFYLAFASDPIHGLPRLGWKSYNDGFAQEIGNTDLGIATRSLRKNKLAGLDGCVS